MRLINISEKEILLELQTTDKEVQEVYLPKEQIHYWYPFNINFFYKYSTAKDYMYLVMDKHYEGGNIYGTTILKRTKKLRKEDGVPFHEHVFKRNMVTINKAHELDIPTIMDCYTSDDVAEGFDKLGVIIHDLRATIEERYMKAESKSSVSVYAEAWDKAMYGYATEEELKQLEVYGEIYTMLSVMRKLAE